MLEDFRSSLRARGAKLFGAVLALATLWLGNMVPTPSPKTTPGDDGLIILQSRCVEDMVRQACRVMNTPNESQALQQGLVFVAGVGAIDPSTYATLQASGDQMCGVVVDACRQDWLSTRCRSSRALFGM